MAQQMAMGAGNHKRQNKKNKNMKTAYALADRYGHFVIRKHNMQVSL